MFIYKKYIYIIIISIFVAGKSHAQMINIKVADHGEVAQSLDVSYTTKAWIIYLDKVEIENASPLDVLGAINKLFPTEYNNLPIIDTHPIEEWHPDSDAILEKLSNSTMSLSMNGVFLNDFIEKFRSKLSDIMGDVYTISYQDDKVLLYPSFIVPAIIMQKSRWSLDVYTADKNNLVLTTDEGLNIVYYSLKDLHTDVGLSIDLESFGKSRNEYDVVFDFRSLPSVTVYDFIVMVSAVNGLDYNIHKDGCIRFSKNIEKTESNSRTNQ